MTKAVIAGGGIAGSIAAVALARVGVEPVVLERYDRTADGAGLFLSLAVNGIDAMNVLGLRHLVADLGFPTPRTRLRNGRGTTLAEFAMGGPLADGTVCRTVSRSDLYGVLRDEAVRAGAEIGYGKELVGAVETGDGVQVTCADGSRIDADLLIGADGLRSRVRQIIDPNAPRATYQGLLNTGGYAKGVPVDAPPGTMVMTFGRKCFFCYMAGPGDEVWWFANPVHKEEPDAARLRELAVGFRESLLEQVAGDATPATALIEASEGVIAPFGTYYFPTVPVWHTDRMLIIGDAAHAVSPASGQGASMAIEDAVELGRCLRDARDVPAALATFEQVRRARVEAVVKVGERNGSGKVAGPVGAFVRDLFMKHVLARVLVSGKDPQRWMWEHHIAWDEPIVSGRGDAATTPRRTPS